MQGKREILVALTIRIDTNGVQPSPSGAVLPSPHGQFLSFTPISWVSPKIPQQFGFFLRKWEKKHRKNRHRPTALRVNPRADEGLLLK
jgi:hypothetical protein